MSRANDCVRRGGTATRGLVVAGLVLALVHAAPRADGTCLPWKVKAEVYVLADIDADGDADIVAFDARGVWTARATGDGRFDPPAFVLPHFGGAEGWTVEKHVRTLTDLNGDRRADIVGFGDAGVWTSLAKPEGGFKDPVRVLDDFGTEHGWTPDKHVRLMADISGDGLADIVGFGTEGVRTALSRGDGHFINPVFALDSFGSEHGWTPHRHVRTMADISGDGVADIVGFADAGVWTALARGDGHFINPVYVVDNFGVQHGWTKDHIRLMADVSGDGLADIVGFGTAGVWTALARGDGHFINPAFVVDNFGTDQGWRLERHVRLMADVSGDGLADILGFGDAGVWTSLARGDGHFINPERVLDRYGTNEVPTPDKYLRTTGQISTDRKSDILVFTESGLHTALARGDGRFEAPRIACSGRFDFNLEWTKEDPNGLPLNPLWTWQREHPGAGPPSAGLCHYFSREIPSPGGGVIKVADFSDCTDQSGPHLVDEPEGFNRFACGFTSGNAFPGHVNWFPVTFEGSIFWGSQNFDDDYYMPLTTEGAPAVLSEPDAPPRREQHTEFDTDETVDHFDTPWWNRFNEAVDWGAVLAARSGNEAAGKEYVYNFLRLPDGSHPYGMMTGLFGVDCAHDCKSELHPVYALAARVARDTSTEVWAMFVRNWGNEGFCSSKNWPMELTKYTFRLPWRPRAQAVEVQWGLNQSVFAGTDGTAGPLVDFTAGRGIDVTFTLPPPSQRPLIEGELHLRWLGTPLPPQAGRPTPVGEEVEHEPVQQAFERLTFEQREQVTNAPVPGPPAAGALRRFPPGRAARAVPSLPDRPRGRVPLGTPEPASHKQARDEARLGKLCQISGGSIPGVPDEMCRAIGGPPGPEPCARERALVASAQAELQARLDEKRNLLAELEREQSPAVKKRIIALIAKLNTTAIPAAKRALAAAEAALSACLA